MGKKIEYFYVKVFFVREKIVRCVLYKLGEFKMMDYFKNIYYIIYLYKCGCIKSKKGMYL